MLHAQSGLAGRNGGCGAAKSYYDGIHEVRSDTATASSTITAAATTAVTAT